MKDEFDVFLERGILAHGFLRLRCGDCGHDKLVAFSCKRQGFCPSCGARRMAQTAAHLVDHVIPHVPVRQWVLSLPIPPRLLQAALRQCGVAPQGVCISRLEWADAAQPLAGSAFTTVTAPGLCRSYPGGAGLAWISVLASDLARPATAARPYRP